MQGDAFHPADMTRECRDVSRLKTGHTTAKLHFQVPPHLAGKSFLAAVTPQDKPRRGDGRQAGQQTENGPQHRLEDWIAQNAGEYWHSSEP
jgi:hypothetical protein